MDKKERSQFRDGEMNIEYMDFGIFICIRNILPFRFVARPTHTSQVYVHTHTHKLAISIADNEAECRERSWNKNEAVRTIEKSKTSRFAAYIQSIKVWDVFFCACGGFSPISRSNKVCIYIIPKHFVQHSYITFDIRTHSRSLNDFFSLFAGPILFVYISSVRAYTSYNHQSMSLLYYPDIVLRIE